MIKSEKLQEDEKRYLISRLPVPTALLFMLLLFIVLVLSANQKAIINTNASTGFLIVLFAALILIIRVCIRMIIDIRNGVKTVFRQTISKKYERNGAFYFYINGKEYPVSAETWRGVSAGKEVLIYFSPRSRIFLGVGI